MSKLKWDTTGKRLYETGLDHGVLFLMGNNNVYKNGVAWNGLTAITENPSGAEANPLYADNIKYLNLIAAEDFGATIEAYTHPREFSACDGTAHVIPGISIGQQSRKMFGLAYRTKLGNDVDGQDHGYKLHLIYGALAAPSERGYQTVNDNPEAITFSWTITTTPMDVPGFRPTAYLAIDSTKADPEKLSLLEEALFGREGVPATIDDDGVEEINSTLPSPAAVAHMITTGEILIPAFEDLCDSSGNQIQDDTGDAVQVRRMVVIV